MKNFEKYFKGLAHVKCLGRAAFIIVAQHPRANAHNLAKNYDANIKSIESYRRWLAGTHTQPIPEHIRKVQDELYYDCKNSDVLTPKQLRELIQVGRPSSKKVTQEPIDFELQPDYESENTEILTKEEKQALVQPKDYVEITDREIRSNRLMYFAGVMTGIALLLLFVMIERA
jgi:hypothetical protein